MRTKFNADLGTGPVGKLLLRLALPAVAAQIINMLYNLVDRMYVGHIPDSGTDALAGLGVCFPVILIVTAFSALVGSGGAPLAAIKLGEKRREDAERILNGGVTLLAIMGVALTIILYFTSRPLLQLFGSPASSLDYGDAYLKIYSLGTVFVMFSVGLNNFISAQGRALTSMLTVAIGAVLNIALDPLFIYAFGMGVRGAAVATVLSQAVSFVWVLFFFCSKRSQMRITPKFLRLSAKIILPMLALGISPFVMQATESAVQIVFNIQIFRFTGGAKEYTAALTVMMSVMQMISLPLNGMGMGAQPLISYNYGAGKSGRVKKTVKYLFLFSLAISATVWIVCLTAPQIFGRIFSATPDVETIIKDFMPIFMMGTVFFCSQFSLQSAFLALNQAKISISLALLRKVILLIPLTFILPLFMGIRGVFAAEGVADLLAGAVTTLAFALRFKKILRKREALLSTASESSPPDAEATEAFEIPEPAPVVLLGPEQAENGSDD